MDARGIKDKYRSEKEKPDEEFLNRKVTRRQMIIPVKVAT